MIGGEEDEKNASFFCLCGAAMIVGWDWDHEEVHEQSKRE